jgi:hypothetical protein
MATNPLAHQGNQPAPIGRRSHPRARTMLAGMVETVEGPRKVKVRNVSRAGAMVETATAPPVGRDLILKSFGIDTMGVVIWKQADCCGIEFYEPIDEAAVVHSRQLSDDEHAQQKWRARQDLMEAAERWSLGKNG